MKVVMNLTCSCLFMLGLFSFAYAIHETQPAETQIAMPGADAAKLYEYITKLKPYTSWSLWPGKGQMYKGTEPHGALLTTYINEAVSQSIRNKMLPMPDASIIVKENYSADKKFDALTVMYKIQGYNPTAGDWFWSKYDINGNVIASGRVAGCINCHGQKKDNDYIMTGDIMKK